LQWSECGQFQTVALTSPLAGEQPLTRRPATPRDPKPPLGTAPRHLSRTT